MKKKREVNQLVYKFRKKTGKIYSIKKYHGYFGCTVIKELINEEEANLATLEGLRKVQKVKNDLVKVIVNGVEKEKGYKIDEENKMYFASDDKTSVTFNTNDEKGFEMFNKIDKLVEAKQKQKVLIKKP